MTTKEKQKYQSPDELRKVFNQIRGRKFRLDCGHHVTFNYFLGNDIHITNGKELEIVCWSCAA